MEEIGDSALVSIVSLIVRRAAKLAMYVNTKISVQIHQVPAIKRVDVALLINYL